MVGRRKEEQLLRRSRRTHGLLWFLQKCARPRRKQQRRARSVVLQERDAPAVSRCIHQAESGSWQDDTESTTSFLSEAPTEPSSHETHSLNHKFGEEPSESCVLGNVRVKSREAAKPRTFGHCVAIDCEMVGVGRSNKSALARVAIVDENGSCLLDEYVKPTEKVTNYRTRWSGIRPRDLVKAPSFQDVRQRVVNLIRGKILVGHAIHNDLNVLHVCHPPGLIRDTSFYVGLRKELAQACSQYDASRPPSLKQLSRDILKAEIQVGEHCPVEDARYTMKLYQRHRQTWEDSLV
ncbi:hypothetical protein GUITHDRAFT_83930 [Guillardia theta CCMP2712]|uniref:RNA exonuclease 4 n=1 Tax=Guillardia theta (strain CCMP2712) TaxID=905079 RepID=L1K396_GUITC|nr:hypothetical protein GUITHDRAFT_83930 [Guillardia theta CCMP2712]EKX55067.1 hypothetical protein GUITHDRAFT_83930 [Guillardia theta CCMP2712]|eukprot:XP_005842047.1 hypothetical protein GUITHDRAFT_83930 [Guillardia theta CCMP2712]